METTPQFFLDPQKFSAIHATGRNPATTTEKYNFISTKDTLDILSDYGFHAVRATQSNVRLPHKEGFQKHSITLESPTMNSLLPRVGRPTLTLRHAHDGASRLHFIPGFLVLVCSNGLHAPWSDGSEIRVAHSRLSAATLEEAIRAFMVRIPGMAAQIERWHQVTLTDGLQDQFARKAIELRFNEDEFTWALEAPEGKKTYPVTRQQVLEVRRTTQSAPTLWNVFNRVQEALVDKGGVKTRTLSRRGNPLMLRPIRGIDSNVKLNKGIWALADEFAGFVS